MQNTFNFSPAYQSFADFAMSIPGATLSGNIITLAREKSAGQIIRAELEPGLIVVHWDIQVKADVTFKYGVDHGEEHFYLLNYYYEPSFESVTFDNGDITTHQPTRPSLIILSRSITGTYHYKAGQRLLAVSIGFSHAWLLQQLFDAKEEKLVAGYILRLLKSVSIRQLSGAESVLTKEIGKEMTGGARTMLLKAYVFSLLSFLYRHASFKARRSGSDTPYSEMLIAVEKFLHEHITETLPPLDIIAEKFFVSPSTLSRHFKAMFNTGITEYLLALKMQHAKHLLQNKKSVNEVAYSLKYENVSHFIAMYKRIYGYSPGKEGDVV